MAKRIPPDLGEPGFRETEPRRRDPRRPPQRPELELQSEFGDDSDALPRVVTQRRPVTARIEAPPPQTFSDDRHGFDDEERGFSIGRIVLGVGVVLVAIAGVAVAAMTLFLPVDLVRDRMIQAVKARTGRDLVVGGATTFSVYPRLAVSLGAVSISPPPGMAGGPTVVVETVEAAVGLWPLLARDVVVERLILQRPKLELRVDAQGRRSWDFAELAPQWPNDRVRYAQAGAPKGLPKELEDFAKGSSQPPAERAPTPATRAKFDNLSLDDVRIVDGQVRYIDERNGAAEDIAIPDLALSLASLQSPLDTRGSISWHGETIAIAGRVTPFRAVLEGDAAHLVLTVQGRPIDLAYDGRATIAGDMMLDGKATLKTTSVAALTAWLGRPVVGGSADGPLEADAKVRGSATLMTLSDARLGFEKTIMAGQLTIDSKGARPHVKGAIRLTEIDLERLMAIKPGQVAIAAVPTVAGGQAAGSAKSIDDLLREPATAAPKASARAPQVRGFTGRAGWSDEALDVSGLSLIDADLRVDFETVRAKDFKTGAGHLVLVLKNSQARLTIEDIALYDGRGRGIVTLDGNAANTVVGANFSIDGVATLPLLKAANGFDWLQGRARFSFAVAGQGRSERQIIQTLNGRADIAMADGALLGIDASKMLRGVQQGRFPGFERVAGDKTDFSEFSATFQIANGIAQNQDLKLTSPLVRLGGGGQINLAGREIAYTLRPKISALPGGQGGLMNLSGVELPIRVNGPWEKPTIQPDLAGMVRDPNAAFEAAKEVARGLHGSDAEKTVKGLLNGDPEAKEKAKGLLNQFLKR